MTIGDILELLSFYGTLRLHSDKSPPLPQWTASLEQPLTIRSKPPEWSLVCHEETAFLATRELLRIVVTEGINSLAPDDDEADVKDRERSEPDQSP